MIILTNLSMSSIHQYAPFAPFAPLELKEILQKDLDQLQSLSVRSENQEKKIQRLKKALSGDAMALCYWLGKKLLDYHIPTYGTIEYWESIKWRMTVLLYQDDLFDFPANKLVDFDAPDFAS